MRTWSTAIAALAVVGVAYSIVQEVGAAGARSFSGSVSVGRVEETFEMPGGFTARGGLGDPRRFSDTRDYRFVPSHYGDVIQVTAHGEDAVLWFRNDEGVVRNVRVRGATQQLFAVQRQDSKTLTVRR